jgi:Uma2 family endonuclease
MAMPESPGGGWNVAMLDAVPDDGLRREIIDGELHVTPAPSWRHQDVVLALSTILRAYLQTHRVGHVLIAPADVAFDVRTRVQPDLFVVPLVEGRRPRSFEEVGHLLLAVEVLSPATARTDRRVKRPLYQREGVDEYWMVDADAAIVERWRPGDERPEVLSEQIVWHPAGAAHPLTIEISEIIDE